MKKPAPIPFATLLLFAGLGLFAGAIPAADSPARTFDWLTGHWCSKSGDTLIEEFWLPAAGDVALGVGRTIKGGKTVSVEFMRIETREGVTNFVALLEGQPPTSFRLTGSDERWARFENPQHDFPKRIELRRTASGLHAEIAGPGSDGKEQVTGFEYRRCPE